jgi:glycerol kinase
VVSSRSEPVRLHCPRPGWVEEDPLEIWDKVCLTVSATLDAKDISPSSLRALGICNQRESVLLWDRKTSKPYSPLISWQDRRTSQRCLELRQHGYEKDIREKTGLTIDPYFSATKIEWLLREHGLKKDACCSTLDSWVLFKLTGRCLTDASNASRTMLYDIFNDRWDDGLLKLFNIPKELLCEVVPTYGDRLFGLTSKEGPFRHRIPVCSVFGDQQAALFGHGCFDAGSVKGTFGTGAFIMASAGSKKTLSDNALISTIYYKEPEGKIHYGLEGSIYNAGSLFQWLKDGLGIIDDHSQIQALASGHDYQGHLFIVPALTGLGAPYWDPHARGLIIGLERSTSKGQIVRACIESIAYRSADVIYAMERDLGRRVTELKTDGGVSQNPLFCQVLADITGTMVIKSAHMEMTSLGACLAAGLGLGIWDSPQDIEIESGQTRYEARIDKDRSLRLYSRWQKAVERAKGWEDST